MVTSAEMTSTTHANMLPTIWASDTRDAIQHAQVLAALCNTKYEDELWIGRVVRIPLRTNLTTQSKTEGLKLGPHLIMLVEHSQVGKGGELREPYVPRIWESAAKPTEWHAVGGKVQRLGVEEPTNKTPPAPPPKGMR